MGAAFPLNSPWHAGLPSHGTPKQRHTQPLLMRAGTNASKLNWVSGEVRNPVTTILMVEDEPFIREFVRDEFVDAGFDVVVASSADEAVAILENRLDIQLVFTDIDMPGTMNGLKLASTVRDRWPPIHIIITTGKDRPPIIPERAVFIPKPYLSRDVVKLMRAFEQMT